MIDDENFARVTKITEIFAVVRIGYSFHSMKSTSYFEETNVDKSLSAVPLLNRTLEDNPIYSTPILVIAGRFCM